MMELWCMTHTNVVCHLSPLLLKYEQLYTPSTETGSEIMLCVWNGWGVVIYQSFNYIVRGNGIKNYLVIHEDIVVAHVIWGKDVHSLEWKTTRT